MRLCDMPAATYQAVLGGVEVSADWAVPPGQAYMFADGLLVHSFSDDIADVLDYRHMRLRPEPIPSAWMAL